MNAASIAANTKSLHMCKVCGCIWRLWKGELGWSLADQHQKPGECCDNSRDFLSKLVPTPGLTFMHKTVGTVSQLDTVVAVPPTPPPPPFDYIAKGCYGGECARNACHNPKAVMFNKGTQQYYCVPCARKITENNTEKLFDWHDAEVSKEVEIKPIGPTVGVEINLGPPEMCVPKQAGIPTAVAPQSPPGYTVGDWMLELEGNLRKDPAIAAIVTIDSVPAPKPLQPNTELNDLLVRWRHQTAGIKWDILLSSDPSQACYELEKYIDKMVNQPVTAISDLPMQVDFAADHLFHETILRLREIRKSGQTSCCGTLALCQLFENFCEGLSAKMRDEKNANTLRQLEAYGDGKP